MTKLLLILLSLLSGCSNNAASTQAQTLGKPYSTIKAYTETDYTVKALTDSYVDTYCMDIYDAHPNCKITVVSPDELTQSLLANRADNEYIVEYDIGFVTNADRDGDGIVVNTTDTYYNYISYRNVPFKTYDGTIILTCFTIEPSATDVDELENRYDVVLSHDFEDWEVFYYEFWTGPKGY